jgi:hypothetical protein
VRFPEPQLGLVIRYSYLWHREHEQGQEEGIKDRPCAIVVSVIDRNHKREVVVLPITHAPPAHADDAIEIPAETKRRLGLDSKRSWIVIAEYNEFAWPGPDLRLVPDKDASSIVYGALPPRFFAYVRNKFLDRDRRQKAARVRRTE